MAVSSTWGAACSSGTDSPTTSSGTSTTSGAGGASGTTSSTAGPGATVAGSTTTSAGTGGAGTGGAGTTGTGGAGGSAAPSVCDGRGTRVLAIGDTKIDDFEAAAISLGWSSFSDVMPVPNSFKIMQEAGGALGTGHFGHYAGTGARTTLMMGYGVGTIYNAAIDTAAGIYCINVAAFDGVSFWAKAATAGSRVGFNFVVPATNAKATDPTLGGGDCVMPGCYNHPAKTVTLTTSWAQYTVTFAEAVGGTGARVTNSLIQQIGWLSPDADWDFSIDEIQFYKGTPPTGPAGSGDAGP